MTPPNEDQARYWNSPDADVWVRLQDRYDTMLRPFRERLLEAARPVAGEKVLDIGCGCGTTTLAIAEAVLPGGSVTAVDLSANMLARARENASARGLTHVRFVQADAQTAALGTSHDLVVSQLGVMFFDDLVAGFRNAWTSARVGGRLVFVCPQEPSASTFMTVPAAVLQRHAVTPMAGAGASRMGSLATPDHTRRLLTDAGWSEVAIDPVTAPVIVGAHAQDAAEFLTSGGPARAALAGAPPEVSAAAVADLVAELRRFETPSGVALNAAMWLVRARRTSE